MDKCPCKHRWVLNKGSNYAQILQRLKAQNMNTEVLNLWTNERIN